MPFPREHIEQETCAAFRRHFGHDPRVLASAPGRVNLIGEHTDYNDGYVLPMALGEGVAVAASPRSGAALRFVAPDVQGDVTVDLAHLVVPESDRWSAYGIGVARQLVHAGDRLEGADLLLHGDLPIGSGLSSSAAVELAVALALQELNGLRHAPGDLAALCQRAEHETVGVRCGMMDQLVGALGLEGHALLIDCRSLEASPVRIPDGVRFLILDTMVDRALAGSAYNTRREECGDAVLALSSSIPGLRSLRDVSPDRFAPLASSLHPILRRRAHHVITEIDRTLDAAQALGRGDMSRFGKLMYDSHLSLQHDYEVSCAELDLMVDLCARCEGVLGARMTGAGFGGCVVCLVSTDAVGDVARCVSNNYAQRTGRSPRTLVSSPSAGAAARHL